jgi:hypothetical protein
VLRFIAVVWDRTAPPLRAGACGSAGRRTRAWREDHPPAALGKRSASPAISTNRRCRDVDAIAIDDDIPDVDDDPEDDSPSLFHGRVAALVHTGSCERGRPIASTSAAASWVSP